MEPEVWRQVEKLYHAALTKPPEQRDTFVAQSPFSDDVRHEVLSLLQQSVSAEGLLDRPVWEGDDSESDQFTHRPPVTSGSVLGPFEIEDHVGSGGMGVVYRARDTRLNRLVAVKFLSDEIATVRLRARFRREAQMASALNHPHILTVYDTGEMNGRPYLVMEYVDGGTFHDWRTQNRDWQEIVTLLAGIAEALAVAHEASILHRDVKPTNILVTKNGLAKLADFGLAKLVQDSDHDQKVQAAQHSEPTHSGGMLGTVAYMSPEQASGLPLDARSDLFSFGVVLYEALALRHPFPGSNEIEILRNIRNTIHEPLPSHLPTALREAVDKTLQKNPESRYASTRELAVELARLAQSSADTTGATPTVGSKGSRPRRMLASVSAAFLLAVALVLFILWRRDYFWRNPLSEARVERLTEFASDEMDAAISPDGRLVSFLSNRDGEFDAWIGHVGSREFLNVTKGRFSYLDPSPIRRLRFSADGTHLWFLRGIGSVQEPYAGWLASVDGGDLSPYIPRAMEVAWSPDGSHVVYHTDDPGDPLYVANPDGSNARKIYAGEPGMHCHHPTWSPDGTYIYFVKGLPTTDEMDVWRVPSSSLSAGAERITNHNAHFGTLAWLDGRTLLYSATAENGSGQWLYSVDVERRIPHRVSSGIREEYLSVASSNSIPRRLVCTIAFPSSALWTIPLSVHPEPETSASRIALSNSRALSPGFMKDDLLFLSSLGGNDGIWRREGDVTRELWTGADGGVVSPPATSPDGTLISFNYRRQGRTRLYVMNANGTNVRTFAAGLQVRGVGSWSPDGKWIAVAASSENGTGIFLVPTGGGSPVQLVNGPCHSPLWSPTGRYIIYSEPVRGSQLGLKAITPDKVPVQVPKLLVPYNPTTPYRFTPDAKALVFLKDIDGPRARNFYWVNLETGEERQLTRLKHGDIISSFDISPQGNRIIFDRLRDNADIVTLQLP